MSRVSPVSGGVLGVAALLSGPVLWGSFVEGTVPLDVALGRFLATVVIAWVALSVFFSLFVPEEAREGQIRIDGVVVDAETVAGKDSKGTGKA